MAAMDCTRQPTWWSTLLTWPKLMLITNVMWLWLAGPYLFSAYVTPEAHPALLRQRYGSELSNTVVHGGDLTRLKHALRRAKQGFPLTFGFLGGSITEGQGARVGNIFNSRVSTRFDDRFMRAFNARYPILSGEHVGVNGGVGASGSNYFAFCAQHHLPSPVDIVVMEHGINDVVLDESQTAAHFEAELRKVLSWKAQSTAAESDDTGPAVIIIDTQVMLASHLLAAIYYDVPMLSTVPGQWLATNHPNNSSKFLAQSHTSADGIHPDGDGHMMMSDVLMAFIDTIIIDIDNEFEENLEGQRLPPVMSAREWGPTKRDCDPATNVLCNAELQARSKCYTAYKPRRDSLTSSMRLAVQGGAGRWVTPLDTFHGEYSFENEALTLFPNSSGWKFTSHKLGGAGSMFIQDRAKVGFEPVDQSGIGSFRVNVASQGRHVAVMYLRSARLGLGSARCWVAGLNHDPVVLNGSWNKTTNVGDIALIDSNVPPGEHAVDCQMTKDSVTSFRIISIYTF